MSLSDTYFAIGDAQALKELIKKDGVSLGHIFYEKACNILIQKNKQKSIFMWCKENKIHIYKRSS